MWLDRDDARSDVVLAGAAAAFGPAVLGLVLLRFLGAGVVSQLVALAVLFVAIGLVPYLLARYRSDVPGAFGIAGDDASGLGLGLVLGLPIVALFATMFVTQGGSVELALTGRLQLAGPTIGALTASGVALRAVEGLVLGLGSWLLVSFLAVRGRDAFRANEMDLTEGLRTFGLALTGASMLLGLLRLLTDLGWANALLTPLVGFGILLLVDRQVPARVTVNRSMLLTPAVTVLVVQFLLTGGGFFRGNLLEPLHRGVSAALLALAVAVLIAVKRARATLVLLAVAALYPTCLSPLPIEQLLGIGQVC